MLVLGDKKLFMIPNLKNIMENNEDSINDSSSEKRASPPIVNQAILYFIFAVAMIFLNILIQNLFENSIFPFIENKYGENAFIQGYILSMDPYNIPELIGSVVTVGITYIIKFFLDKLIVFRKTHSSLQQTGKEFIIYLLFAVFTTIENLGIQFILGVITMWALNFRIAIALTCGYITKFILDRKFVFSNDE